MMSIQYFWHILKLDLSSGTGNTLLQYQRYVFVNTGNHTKMGFLCCAIVVKLLWRNFNRNSMQLQLYIFQFGNSHCKSDNALNMADDRPRTERRLPLSVHWSFWRVKMSELLAGEREQLTKMQKSLNGIKWSVITESNVETCTHLELTTKATKFRLDQQ